MDLIEKFRKIAGIEPQTVIESYEDEDDDGLTKAERELAAMGKMSKKDEEALKKAEQAAEKKATKKVQADEDEEEAIAAAKKATPKPSGIDHKTETTFLTPDETGSVVKGGKSEPKDNATQSKPATELPKDETGDVVNKGKEHKENVTKSKPATELPKDETGDTVKKEGVMVMTNDKKEKMLEEMRTAAGIQDPLSSCGEGDVYVIYEGEKIACIFKKDSHQQAKEFLNKAKKVVGKGYRVEAHKVL